ncbi:MAG: RagB/SusD family nutrient uptake outer membrane protein [Gemmatimonadaceae bacterium]
MSKSSSQSALRFLRKALLLLPVFFVGETCTKLTEVPHDALTPTTAFHTDQEILAGLAGVYAQLRSAEANDHFAALEELSTDMLIVPTRGSDWYDNGQWLDIHKQIWQANSAGALSFLSNAWNDSFAGVAKANLMIDVVTKAAPANKDTVLAELRTLRAWYYYMLQDQFGGVPLVTTTELQSVARSTRPQVFSFIETELTQSIATLPKTWDASNYGRITKGAANAILASLYLNAGVFNKDCGPADCTSKISATSYNSCSGVTVAGGKDACQAAIDAANAVINSGTYSINPTWAKNFSIDNKSSPENIFVVVHSNSTQGIGGNWPMRTLHYNQLSTGDGGPWNGFATTAEVYNSYPASDDRRNMWLVGQQKSFENGLNVNDRQGNPLIFTPTIPDVTKADEAQGVRFNKFPPQASPPHGGSQPNDFTWFRLSEMYLIRAEALNEQGNTASALTDLNFIHTKHDPNNPVAAGTKQALRDAIQKERVLEFAAEGKRRTDMIRAGTFLSWTEASANGVSATPRAAFRVLFPISTNALGSNAKLVQNNGY